MVCFSTKNPNLGKIFRVSDKKMLIYFMDIWYILWTFGIFYDHLPHCVLIWYIFSSFGVMHQGKSGNPDSNAAIEKTKDSFFSPKIGAWTRLNFWRVKILPRQMRERNVFVDKGLT
jgi:hypothetical protein